MKLRNCDWPLLNSPVLSLAATQLVILSSAYTYVNICLHGGATAYELTIFAELVVENDLIGNFERAGSCTDIWRSRRSMSCEYIGVVLREALELSFYGDIKNALVAGSGWRGRDL
jgi:hypothetical protein